MDLTKVDNGIITIEKNLKELKKEVFSKKLKEDYLDNIFENVERIITKILEVDEWFRKHSGDFREVYDKKRNDEDSQNYISALKFIENERKHGKKFLKLYTKKPGGMTMNKLVFPMKIPANSLIWKDIDEKIVNPKYLNQLKSYRKKLVNLDVIYTLESSLNFLKEMQKSI